MKFRLIASLTLSLTFIISALVTQAQTSTFTYQGQLKSGNIAVNQTSDFEFRLFDAPSGGSQIGLVKAFANVSVQNGLFSVPLDFGAEAFGINTRYLEISVRTPAGVGSFTKLSTRQKITASPQANYAAKAANADSLTLPYTASGATASPVFQLTNTGTGNAVNASSSGTGSAGFFGIFNASNSSNALTAQTNGAGSAFFGYSLGNATAGLFRTESFTTSKPTLVVQNNGKGNALDVTTSGTAGSAGSFISTNPANSYITLYSESAGSGNSIYSTSKGTGDSIKAYAVGTGGSAGHFILINPSNTSNTLEAENYGNGGAALFAKGTGNGTAVTAHHTQTTGTALEITSGAIKVTGAGFNTNTAVFVLKATNSNLSEIKHAITIDNPLCNNNPHVMLFANATYSYGDTYTNNAMTRFAFFYDDATHRWLMIADNDFFKVGEMFNVMIIKP